MRYPDGGGLTEADRARREQVRLQAADVSWLPAYAPELNPVESLWAHLKTGVLANLAARSLDHLIRVIRTAIKCLQYRPDLLQGFLTGTGLQLEPP